MNEKTNEKVSISRKRLLQLGQLFDCLPEDDGASDMDVEGANQPTLGNLHTIIHLADGNEFGGIEILKKSCTLLRSSTGTPSLSLPRRRRVLGGKTKSCSGMLSSACSTATMRHPFLIVIDTRTILMRYTSKMHSFFVF